MTRFFILEENPMTRQMMTQQISVYLIAGLLVIVFAAWAQAITVVSPAGSEDTEGNILFFPVDSPFPNTPDPPPPPLTEGWRAQELHPASSFDSLGTGPFELTSLAWRPDISVTEPTSAEWEFALNLSTTSVGTLSTTFADNIGAGGVTEVFSGTLQLQTDGVPRGGGLPHEFDYDVEFHTPFFYDPQQGDLLVEWKFSGLFSDQWVWIDADDRTGEFVFGLSVDAEEALPAAPGLFVTEFTVIPEPSALLLAFIGLAVLGGWRKWKRAA
jgi:hypothetical protein